MVLAPRSVSRRHARIVRRGDAYELEDLGSTGGTTLNGRPLTGPTRLRDGDRIELGDCTLAFSDPAASVLDAASGATILGERDASAEADSRAEEKLRAILEIGRDLAGAVELEGVLDRALAALFRIFAQAERGFVLLREHGADELSLRAFRGRGVEAEDLRFSRTIFEHVTASGRAVLCADVTDDERFAGASSVDEAQVRTMMCVPLRDHRRRPVGILQLDTRDANAHFGGADLDLLVAVSGPVAVAIDNARLLGEARRARAEAEAASLAKDQFLAVLSATSCAPR